MERRKLMRPLDDYIHSITQTQEEVSKKTYFYNSLRHFYRKKWGCPLKVPSIHGVELDLHLLYETVINLGGWSKVSNHERWPQVLHKLGIDEDVQVAEYAVRMLYMRFLVKYEQAETGNDPDEHDSDLMGSRSRMKGHLSNTYSEAPTSVPKSGGMSHESSGPEYSKILKSLLSGLPNEVDFAVNVCSLLSNPGPYLLKLGDCTQLMTALVAHCCIFNDGTNSLEDLHFNAWQQQSSHDFANFWTKAGINDTAVLSLMPQTIQSACSSAVDQLDFEDDRLDLKNSINWRVFQILSIFRNLSFEECNKCAMASNLPLLKFLLICCNSKWQQLVNGAFDILSNISTEINLTMEGSIFSEHLLLKTLSMGLFSDDKFQILRAIEIFTGLCNNKCNETLICEFAEEKILSRIFTLVTAKDILLCIITLESLYQMSELGRTSCEVLSAHSNSVDILVNLATTDAASFGSSGLAGIKVVEIHGHTGQLQPYHPQRSNHSMTPVPLLPVRPNSPATSRNLYSSPPPPSSPSLVRHHFAPPPSPLAVVRPPLASTPSGTTGGQVVQKLVPKKGYAMPAKIQTVNRTSALKTFIPSGGMTSPPPAVQEVIAGMNSHSLSATTPIAIVTPSQGQESKLERMTKNYINEHCSAEEKAVSNRGEMYAHYVEYMQSHDMLSGSLQMFINQLKSCFPSITITHSPGSSVHSVEGIRFTKVVSNGNSQKPHNLASQHPLMQQMLSSPTLNGHADNTTSKDHLSDAESIPFKTEAVDKDKTTENNNQNEISMVNGHLRSQEKLNHHKDWAKKSTANGETICNGVVDEKDCFVTTTTNGGKFHPKVIKGDSKKNEDDEQKAVKLIMDDEDEQEEEMSKSPKMEVPNGLITPLTLKGRKRGSTNGTPKSWSKKPKVISRTSTSSSLSSVPETTNTQTPASINATSTTAEPPAVSRCTAVNATVIDASQPSTSAPPGDYMCEWDCCGRFFNSGSAMLYHNAHHHLNGNEANEEQEGGYPTLLICKWPSCDGTPRSRWSMVTHLQDHHCTEHQLQAALRTRREMGHYNYMAYLKQQLEKVKDISHHPGYSKFAAVEAIRRHAFSYMTKDLTDDSEGPVTRSMRLTSSLILRNIAKHSVEGRRKIRKHESHLSWMALSRMESSAALAQCLGELAQHSALSNISENELDLQQNNC